MPAVFLLRAGPRCWRAVLSALSDEERPVKFLMLSRPGGDGKLKMIASLVRLIHKKGWLCFGAADAAASSGHLGSDQIGKLTPLFAPFDLEPYGEGMALIFCGREDDIDLDRIIHLTAGG